ncbi:MAG: hypothetical protein JSV04_13400 [Candidatus Heimdallarchaeota archaeon]|nr:MAG: hypothetical protein JSV04_13400 [Candidatus Heimdallarchaeota archaeon]
MTKDPKKKGQQKRKTFKIETSIKMKDLPLEEYTHLATPLGRKYSF